LQVAYIAVGALAERTGVASCAPVRLNEIRRIVSIELAGNASAIREHVTAFTLEACVDTAPDAPFDEVDVWALLALGPVSII
jgi:hypothetical protein